MHIGRYEILQEIGQGAMGTVFRARDPLIGRELAIKSVPLAHLQSADPDAHARFLREARSAGRLTHPNIVTIYDVGEAEGLAYIAMEHLDGQTLRTLMDQGALPLTQALGYALQMAEALAFAHEKGVVHRDIKPANVVVLPHGHIKITDFGIAHFLDHQQTLAGQMIGSPRYMSPEQAKGEAVDDRTDLFSLGVVLYEMLAGRHAFEGNTLAGIVYRVIHDSPRPLPSLRQDIPAEIDRFVRSLLSKRPAHRPSARAAADHLRGLISLCQPARPRRRPWGIVSRRALLAAGAPAGVIVLAWSLWPDTAARSADTARTASAPASSVPRLGAPPQATLATPGMPGASVSAPGASADLPTFATPGGPDTQTRPAATQTPAPARRPVQPDPYLVGIDQQINALRLKRSELLLRYTELHPDVVLVDRQLANLSTHREELLESSRRRHRNL